MDKITLLKMVLDIISVVLSIIAIIIAFIIPYRIYWGQFYNNLIAEYRSLEFGKAMQSVIIFFTNKCGKDVSRVQKEYEIIYKKQIIQRGAVAKPSENNLHYQRRMLAQFFVDLDKCAKSPFIRKKRIQKDFTKGTQKLVKILFFMGVAVENSSILFEDIACKTKVPISETVNGQNKYLSHIYEVLEESKEYME